MTVSGPGFQLAIPLVDVETMIPPDMTVVAYRRSRVVATGPSQRRRRGSRLRPIR